MRQEGKYADVGGCQSECIQMYCCWGPGRCDRTRGPIFEKFYDELTKKLMKKSDLRKNLGWACDYQKILQKSYEKLRTTLHVSYEFVKFVASDVIRETLCQRLLLVEYFQLKITDNHAEWRFPKNAFDKWLTIFLRKS